MTAQEAVERPNGLTEVLPVLEKAESGRPQEPVTGVAEVPLPQDLEDAFRELKDQFTIDSNKLNDIVEHFQRELAEGLAKENQNIVRTPHRFGTSQW